METEGFKKALDLPALNPQKVRAAPAEGWDWMSGEMPDQPPAGILPDRLDRFSGDVRNGPQPAAEDVVRHMHSDLRLFHEHAGGSEPHEHPELTASE